MKSDLLPFYRSPYRPRPLWPEPALYGGYKYIELSEDIWVPRTLEYAMLCAQYCKEPTLQQLAQQEIRTSKEYFRPSPLQKSDYFKLLYTLSQQTSFAVSGYAIGLQRILESLTVHRIYTDAEYASPNIERVSTEQLCNFTSNLITLIPVTSSNLKSNILNWGNVIIYDEDILVETSPTGGIICQ